ncbi:M56 family metallopeptidase [Occallatibacter savannae]|uniref:M56 family metallopeptidase n=1 Tax=Occallatibacter savannae TaxID=1002691 RepID=UPI000D6884E5|nr:M56 family metallopeptidase [Occallatibacter savannae]
MISSLLLEAALRSVLLALAVWAGLRLFGIKNVLAQKAAWGLVLVSALGMPMLLPYAAHWSVLPANVRVVIPEDPQTLLEELQARIKTSPQPKPASKVTPSTQTASSADESGVRVGSDSPGRQLSASAQPEPADPEKVSFNESENAPQNNAVLVPQAAPQPPPAPHITARTILTGLLWFYIAVAGVLMLRLLNGLNSALHLLHTAEPIVIESHISTAQSLKLRSSTRVASPVTIGSSIVLPADYRNWDSNKLRVVIAHERSHIRQGDFYLQLLAGVYAAAVWFSPLGWWLKRKLSDLAEAISDRAGLEEASDRAAYAQILLEFAAAPRPTLIGVAMARNGSVSKRIERLLNDASFRQAFAGTRRGLAALAVVPVALFIATALVRVEAASQQALAPDKVTLPVTEAIAPDALPVSQEPQKPARPGSSSDNLPAPALAPTASDDVLAPRACEDCAPSHVVAPPAHIQGPADVAPVPPAHIAVSPRVLVLPGSPGRSITMIAPAAPGHARVLTVPQLAPLPPHSSFALVAPGVLVGGGHGFAFLQDGHSRTVTLSNNNNGKRSGYRYYVSDGGDSYAIVRGSDHITMNGQIHTDEIEKARQQAGGKDFLWFKREGKAYVIDDPATLARIETMYKPMEDLGRQQEELGKKQEALGKQQEEIGHQQEQASVPTPDMSREIAEIEKAMAQLKANQGKNMTQEQFGELQEKLGELQGRLGDIQGEIGSKQGEFGEKMGALGEQMGKLGEQMGELGEQQGRIAEDADRKVKSIIDESMKDGKARPVQ